MKIRSLLAVTATSFLLAACGQDGQDVTQTTETSDDFRKELQSKLIKAKAGDVIEIPEGTFTIDRSLSLNVDGVTIRGAGMDKTILSFKGQVAGAEGLLVNANDFVVEDLAIEDTKGDALKVNQGENIVIRRVRVEWTNGPDNKNGAYGLYPVQTENTLIEDSIAIGASDAGIYVGQSNNVIVRNNRAEYNVAGIEIENTIGADVYGNVATNNTGGILIFNMPQLTQPGHSTRIYQNQVFENNYDNFGTPGTAVAAVPAGSGILINSNDNVEIFDNDIKDNKTANVIVSSYFTAGYEKDYKQADNFDPYPEGIFVYNNRFEGGGDSPDRMELKALKIAEFGFTGSLPDILWDGIVNPDSTVPALCIDNGDSGVVNVDAGNGYSNITTDMTPHRCEVPKLAAISLETMEG
ncbi:parallel beta-helix domain-containing protein [Endozoicomonas ascidiicola]|uniref:parallel beta-helix domain-containing protein n=1 Tax=Endozoicomonas ascidiicola TaxID=1698521 RepID=UPI0008372FCC|nr:parallel beta-helix domain-containing protein [Endozoicomonas ascidiicola]